MVNAGIKSGKLHQGYFNANQYNYLEVRVFFNLSLHAILSKCIISQGTVRVTAFNKPVLVAGRQNMNRAMQGDIVAIEMLPRSEWRTPADAVVDQDGRSMARWTFPFHSLATQLR
jgi:exosome complex exonuclease DIS3/RRP44